MVPRVPLVQLEQQAHRAHPAVLDQWEALVHLDNQGKQERLVLLEHLDPLDL